MNSRGRQFLLAAAVTGMPGFLSITFPTRAASPIILQQPQSQIVGSGETVQFFVVAQSDLPLTYQWLFNDAALISATNSTLTLNNVQPFQTGKYSALVANSAATNASLEAFLQVCWEVQLASLQQGLLSNLWYDTSLKFDSAGNLYVGTILTNDTGFSIAKLAQAAQQAWQAPFYTAAGLQYLSCRGLAIDSAGNVCIVGVTATNYYSDSRDIIVWKLGNDGKLLWSSGYHSAGLPQGIAEDASGNVYVGGTLSEGIFRSGMEIKKFNAAGQSVWELTDNQTLFGALAADLSGSIYVAGASTSSPPELVLTKYDGGGARLWLTNQSLDGYIYSGSSLLVDAATNLIVGLTFAWGAPIETHETIKYDQNGKMLWAVNQPQVSDVGSTVGWTLDQSNSVYFGSVGLNGFTCAKYDPDGNQLWATPGIPEDPFFGGVILGLNPAQDLVFASLSGTGVLGIGRYQQNLVPGKPVIHGVFAARRVANGTTVPFNTVATGEAPLAYHWRRDSVSLPGATNATLVLTNVTTGDSGNYSVVVTNTIGCAVSAPGSLMVIDVEPFFLQQLGVNASNVTFRVVGEAGRLYWLEVSTNLTDWSELVGFGVDGTNDLIFPKLNQSSAFYRLRTTP